MNTRVGLCLHCRHTRVIENRRGSTFRLCELSREDSRFRRYPPLPVLQCQGFEKSDSLPEELGE